MDVLDRYSDVDPSLARPDEPHAVRRGINVHAKLSVAGNDRAQLERLCRYLGRPPIAQERLECLSDGRLRYTFKKAWEDGTRAVVLDPLDLIARVVAMIPAPGFHMVRYHGVLSSHSSLRSLVVPTPPAPVPNPLLPEPSGQLELGFDGGSTDSEPTSERRKPKPWAWLLRHVFQEDVRECTVCGGPVRWVEVATSAEAIARVLGGRAHSLRSRGPPAAQLLLRFG